MEWIIASMIALVGTIIGSSMQYSAANKANKSQTDVANKQNELAEDTLEYNKEKDTELFEYNKWLNQMQMDREDTAVQRRMEDLKAAGLNPLLAAGDAATSGAGGTLSRNSVNAPDLQAPDLQNPFAGFGTLFNNAYQQSLQGYETWKKSQEQDASISLIKSQQASLDEDAEYKKIRNEYANNEFYNKQVQNWIKIQDYKADVNLKLSKLQGQENSNEYQSLKKIQQGLINQEEQIKLWMMEHDWEIFEKYNIPTSVQEQGAQTTFGKAMQDYYLGVNPDKKEDSFSPFSIFTGNDADIPNLFEQVKEGYQKLQDIPEEEVIRNPDGSFTWFHYQNDGKIKVVDGEERLYAGTGYKVFPDNSFMYGGFKVKKHYSNDFSKLIKGGKKLEYVPMLWLE